MNITTDLYSRGKRQKAEGWWLEVGVCVRGWERGKERKKEGENQ